MRWICNGHDEIVRKFKNTILTTLPQIEIQMKNWHIYKEERELNTENVCLCNFQPGIV